MAKKKAAKKKVVAKKKVKPSKKSIVKKSAAKKKRPAKKSVVKKASKKASRPKRPATKASRSKAPKKKAPARLRKSPSKLKRSSAPSTLPPNQYLEQMSVTIEGPDKSGDLVATESMGGDIRVHHTVHPDAETTAIPGQSYRDLKNLGEGTHEIEVVRSIAPPPVVSPTEKSE